MTVWEDDDDEVGERRASEPLVAGPLVQPRERIELVLVLTGSGDPGIEAPLSGRRDDREVEPVFSCEMSGRGRVPLAVYLILFSSACATAGGSARLEGFPGRDEGSAPISRVDGTNRSESRIPTLLVENASGDHIAVRLNGFRLGTATGGRNRIPIPKAVGKIVLEFDPVGMDSQLA